MKHSPSRRFEPAAILLLTLLAGCSSSPNAALYAIAVQPGPVVTGAPKTIEVHEIGLAGYLDRPGIVRSSEGYRLDVLPNDVWGESLGAMIGRVLVGDLGQRLPASNVYSERGAIAITPDASLAVNIQRMDVDSNGQLVLLAQAIVEFRRGKPPVTRTFRIAKPAPSGNAADEVAAISAALGQLADELALMLRA